MKIAVIPARGGSKRIPGKNIRPFCGKPIIVYSIEAARESGVFDEIIVSTDDDEIAAIARQAGATTPFMRPKELADDHTGTAEVVKHAIAWFLAKGKDVSHVCCIYPTAPLVQAHFLREAYDLLAGSDAAFAFSVTSYAFPIQRALRFTAGGRVVPFHPEHRMTRSQDLEAAFHDAGQFYWGTVAAFRDGVPIFSEHSVGIVLPRHLVQDIDTIEDWEQAEYMFRAINRY
ncbi:pseudaminic acid cytidylyltransferase [Bradyrhizobium sp. 164]|uniref:pseudaminic acid cytidylyltransferase n=1 Tax=Bradyrhizobium sp. 164 TaxID=2782637 RepID=UPI001FFBC275|nr:pseudaminic acid cytidylyltransferase [Bradyrhizobium sp. 164]MCK1594671.1 pseudaminic acid cytidylyltransferase [Bradyrhizobium sp. 164]